MSEKRTVRLVGGPENDRLLSLTVLLPVTITASVSLPVEVNAPPFNSETDHIAHDLAHYDLDKATFEDAEPVYRYREVDA